MHITHLFRHKLRFTKADPLGGGLREEIQAEQNDANRITLDRSIDQNLSDSWARIVSEVEKDPTWTKFTED